MTKGRHSVTLNLGRRGVVLNAQYFYAMGRNDVNMIVQISDSELELMKIIWANGGMVYYAQIMEELQKTGRDWQKNTIMTFLSRLIGKGFIKSHKMGRKNEYNALISEVDYQAAQTQNFLNKLYEGNAKGLIATMIQREMLTPDDCEELKRFWEGKRDE